MTQITSSLVPPSPAQSSGRRSGGKLWSWVLLPALATGVCGAGYWWFGRPADNSALLSGATFFTVAPTDLDVKIAKDGELQALNNVDIQCHVEGINTITYVIPEGTNVKPGDTLVTLDSSTIKHKLDDLKVSLDTAQANLVTAQQFEEIQISQNQANLDAAQVALDLAKLDLEAYQKGTFPQAKDDAETQLKMADQTLANAQDDLNNTMALFAKGFVTPSDVKKSELAVTTAQNARDKAKTALDVLMTYQHKKDLTTFQSAVAQAEQKLEHTRAENAANLTQKKAVTRSASMQVRLLQGQFDDQKEQFDNCTIKAPSAGFVIYSSSLDRNAQVPIQEGTSVREKQLLIRLPDTSGMKAVVRIPEAQRSRIYIDDKNPMRAIVRIPQATKSIEVTGWVSRISPIADMSQRWINPDLKEYPVDITLDWVPPNLKPSESVKAEVFCEHLTGVIAVPLDCIYSAGADNFVFARTGDEIKPVKVTLGESTDTHAQVASGLSPGTDILRLQVGQGRTLLEKAGIKLAPTTRPSAKFANGKSGKKAEAPVKAAVGPKPSANATEAPKVEAAKTESAKPVPGGRASAAD